MTDLGPFLEALMAIPEGYSQGVFEEARWGTTLTRAAGGRRYKLYAERLGGDDHVSFNLYLTGDGAPRLKPCEMPAARVIDFVLSYAPESA
ncbi:MAG: hypothetical protein AAFQ62_07215 [Pseudomonadota bacterium]